MTDRRLDRLEHDLDFVRRLWAAERASKRPSALMLETYAETEYAICEAIGKVLDARPPPRPDLALLGPDRGSARPTGPAADPLGRVSYDDTCTHFTKGVYQCTKPY